ncbi:ABC transporter permease [Streptomyces sp. 549]|uniref:ABC transporter permease n=1 Tax=Streptomyces sp. 549 TaxID=3049076 RepID=UPI0024C3AE75|nr:ABC transporter permease [Streptomyces sp. 549]MDK1472278.1 ABC transporter permease [Streptomyces sp. 549]
MNVFQLAVSNVISLRRRLIGLVLLVSLAAAFCLAAIGVADQAQNAADTGVKESTANRSITVERPVDRTDVSPLTEQAEQRLAALPGVVDVQHQAQVSFAFKDEAIDGVLLYATTHRKALTPPVTASVRKSLFPLRAGEMVLPARAQGDDLRTVLGKRITVDTTRFVSDGEGTGATSSVRVVGLYDPSWQLDGPDAAYTDDATVVNWAAAKAGVPEDSFLSTVGYNQLTILTASSGDVPAVLDSVQAMGFPASTLQQQLHALPTVLELIRLVGKVLLGVLGLLAFAGAITVTGALSRQRAREIGILKALGFRTRTVCVLLVFEMVLVGAAAALLGLVGGAVLSTVTAATLRGIPDLAPYLGGGLLLPSPATSSLLLAATVLVVAAGSLLPARRAARLAPTDAMKDW